MRMAGGRVDGSIMSDPNTARAWAAGGGGRAPPRWPGVRRGIHLKSRLTHPAAHVCRIRNTRDDPARSFHVVATDPPWRRPLSDPAGPVCGAASARIAVRSSGGGVLVICAATVEPADVPMIRPAAVTSTPAPNRPAMRTISHAFPADPPPPSANARLPRMACVGSLTLKISVGVARAELCCLRPRLAHLSKRRRAGRLNCVSQHREARTRSATRSPPLPHHLFAPRLAGAAWPGEEYLRPG